MTTNPPSVSVDLPVLDIFYQGNHMLGGLLCLDSFTELVGVLLYLVS
jgi:hypothetical protein